MLFVRMHTSPLPDQSVYLIFSSKSRIESFGDGDRSLSPHPTQVCGIAASGCGFPALGTVAESWGLAWAGLGFVVKVVVNKAD
jgi:hypothetical protein